MTKDYLFWCARCHRKFQEMGEVLEYGKYYPAAQIKHVDGRVETRADSWEIKKALCLECMVAVNTSKFDREMGIFEETTTDLPLENK